MESPSATRLSLMTTAERLFAERGINAVSAREIAAEAGQRNTNAVKYHFGSAQALVDAVFRFRMEPLNARRIELIARSDADGRADDPYALAEAFVTPLAELLDDLTSGSAGGSWYLRFCVQAAYTVHPGVATPGPGDLGRTPWTTGLKELNDRALALGRATLPGALAWRRWTHFTGFATHALADREQQLTGATPPPDDATFYLADLIDAGAALLTAPARPSTLALTPAEESP